LRAWSKSILTNDRGFSLTELMIGGAILAGVALAGATLFKNQVSSQKSIDHDQELALFHTNLANTIKNTPACNATFNDWINTPSIPAGQLDPSNGSRGLFRCSNPTNCNGYTYVKGTPRTDLIPPDPADNKVWISNKKIWQIANLGLPYTVTSSGDLRLQVTYADVTANPVRTVNKEIVVGVRFKTGVGSKFLECVNPHVSTINNIQSDFCKTLNPSRSKTSDGTRMATWNEETQKCDLVDYSASTNCPNAGEIFKGYSANGEIVCAPLPTSDKLTEGIGPSNQLAPGCESAFMSYDKVTKSFRLYCDISYSVGPVPTTPIGLD
jgi:type II secretory pathway pseudopilin PulG